jgi:uncharacterized protein
LRVPSDQRPARPRARRRNLLIAIIIAALIVLFFVVQGLAGFYADFLWFHFAGIGEVWRQVIVTKVVLAAVFVVIAWAVLWASLAVVDTVAPRAALLGPDNELVRRYQSTVGPHARALRTVISFVIALILGAGASGQWQHWILFNNSLRFNEFDPLFHRDASFFVFRLPFLSFLVDWIFTTLVVVFIVTAIAYFLNGAIRLSRGARVEGRAVAHLSLILAFLALERAWAYYYVDRYVLDLSTNGVVQGAGYTDVHVRLPAMTLLAIVSLIAFVLFSVNVYQRSVVLPGIGLGLWALLALSVGVIYPALFQALRVTPAQSRLEQPYIQDNIAATRFAMGIEDVQKRTFPANEDLTSAVLDQYQQTLRDVVLWDPNVSLATFAKLQQIRSYYSVTTLNVDRYMLGHTLTPVAIGVRALNTSGLAQQSWVNTHLQFTHGYGAVVAEANTTSSANVPNFLVSSVPVSSTNKALHVTTPSIYYSPSNERFVVADTKQPEVLYQKGNGSSVYAHCHGCGGVPISGLFSRLAFAIHLRDLNLLISNLITSKSQLIYLPDIETRVRRALPFLSVDSHPYAVIVNGQIDWLLDAYTTTSSFPYAQTAENGNLPSSSGLSGDFNYVRDAVKVVVNAYTGKMSFYVIAPRDPLIRAYERVFPGLLKPLKDMNPQLQDHLRYPQDLLEVQAEMYGRYHITSPTGFYSLSDAWDLSETSNSASGSPSLALATGPSGFTAPFTPVYELLQLPGQSRLSFDALEPLVPFSSNGNLQTLRALFVANSNRSGYGQLSAYVTPGQSIHGPGLANADISADPTISKAITLLDSKGSQVYLGTVQVLPIADSLIYVRPLYVSSTQTPFPQLEDVIVVYGKEIAMEPTLSAALSDVFGSAPSTLGPPTTRTGQIPEEARADIAQASADFAAAQAALASGNLGAYQADVTNAGRLLSAANAIVNASTPGRSKATAKKSSLTNPAATPA